MKKPRCTDTDSIAFLVAAPQTVGATGAARVRPSRPDAPAHGAFTRPLHRLEPDPAARWHGVAPRVERERGVPIADDTTLDEPYARERGPGQRHWSGKQHAVADGIDPVALVWGAGERLIPRDGRVDDKPNGGMAKDEHVLAMPLPAHRRGSTPESVLLGSRPASIDDPRLIRDRGRRWRTRRKANRRVGIDPRGKRASGSWPVAATGTEVHPGGYGAIRVFRVPATGGETGYRAANDRGMGDGRRVRSAAFAWGIEVYHRALEQGCHVERARVRAARAQRDDSGMAIRAFVRLGWHRLRTGSSRGAARAAIIRAAVRTDLAHPRYRLPSAYVL